MRKERNMLLHFFLCLFSVFPFTLMTMGSLQENSTLNATNSIAKPLCPTKCGNVTIPYPFGIGNDTGCALDDSFYVTCNETSQKLFLGSGNIGIYNISDSELRIETSVAFRCYNEDGSVYDESDGWTPLNAILTLSEKNKFIVIGCDDYGLFSGKVGGEFSSGCIGLCSEAADVVDGQCSGNGCCLTSITKGLRNTNYTLNSFQNHSSVFSINDCGYAFLAEEDSFKFRGKDDISGDAFDVLNNITSTVPIVVDWVIARDQNCSNSNTHCKENSSCDDIDGGGYRCRCEDGYEGNPYLDQGCQDIDECKNNIRCYGHICINTAGSFNCTCSPGYIGDARKPDGCQPILKDAKFPVLIFTLGIVLGTCILVSAFWSYKVVQKRKIKKRRDDFFKRNGGLLLQQQTSSGEDTVERIKLFSAIELEKATDQYNRNRIVGQGGQGTVYKGMLPDGKIVAVKKSKLVDEFQVETFINEVFLLSQISHKNVVKLLGCCLETEVPILVYEFVANGDLFHFIHDENYEFPSLWSMRLQIVTEVAGALAYMHHATSIPIYHRDIKSSNILLDDKFRAKLSDFGISKSVIGDQTHLSTLVKGTFGYIDPEYFQSNQFTDKSDVYSFGIVLVEILTGKKPIYSIGPGESRSLATLILSNEEGLLLENIDDRVLDGPKEQLMAVAMIVKRCLNLNGTLRPTMKEVAAELECIRSSR